MVPMPTPAKAATSETVAMSSTSTPLWNDAGSVVGNFHGVIIVRNVIPGGGSPVALRPVNTMRTRLQSLGLLDRAPAATTDDEIDALVAALDDDHPEAVERLADGVTPTAIREAASKGRVNGTLEGIAVVLVDACLADCIEQLGEHADNPTSDQLRELLPGLIERHGLACTRTTPATTVVGEAPASADRARPVEERRRRQAATDGATPDHADRAGAACVRRRTRGRQGEAPRDEVASPGRGAGRREQSARDRHHH